MDQELLLVGATLDGANELARQVASIKGAAFGWHRLSLSQLVAASAAPALAACGLVPLSRIATEAIVTRLVHRLRAEGKIGRYQFVSEMPGFSRAITGVIAELRSAGLRSNAVESIVPDLVPIVREYERELTEGGLIDWPGTLELATSAIAGLDPPRLAGLPTLLLDVPISTEAELGFVASFAAAAPEVHATIPTGDAATLARLRDGLNFIFKDLDDQADSNRTTSALAQLSAISSTSINSRAKSRRATKLKYSLHPARARVCGDRAPGPSARRRRSAVRSHGRLAAVTRGLSFLPSRSLVEDFQVEVSRIQREAAAADALHGSRTFISFSQAGLAVLEREVLSAMQLVYNHTGKHTGEVYDQVAY